MKDTSSLIDINSNVAWHKGMRLTATTFDVHDAAWDRQQQLLWQFAAHGSLGLLPTKEFMCKAAFVKNKLELNHLQCMALLPSGRILDIDEDAVVPISKMPDADYYVTAFFTDETQDFELQDVRCTRPVYGFALRTITQAKERGEMPVLKLKVGNGRISIDENYILPSLLLGASPRNLDFASHIREKLMKIATHKHIADLNTKCAFMQFWFMVGKFDGSSPLKDFLRLTIEIHTVSAQFIVKPSTEFKLPIDLIPLDLALWYAYLIEQLDHAIEHLDHAEVKEEEIDYSKLKAEILTEVRQNLYPTLKQELFQGLCDELTKRLREHVSGEVLDKLKQYLNDSIRPRLEKTLSENLTQELPPKLYKDLNENLYKNLYDELSKILNQEFEALAKDLPKMIPQEEIENKFIPWI